MDANTWFTISIVGYSLAVVLLIVAIILFYKMNIKAIIGDLSGKTAARQIQEIREHNTNSGHKRFMPSAFNVERGSLTEPVSSVPSRSKRLGNSNRLGTRGETGQTVAPVSKRLFRRGRTVETSHYLVEMEQEPQVVSGKLENKVNRDEQTVGLFSQDTQVLVSNDGTEVLVSSDDTQVLVSNDGTEVLIPSAETEVLLQNEATELLSPSAETEVLNDDEGTTVLYPTAELEQEDSQTTQAIPFKMVKDIKIIHSNETF